MGDEGSWAPELDEPPWEWVARVLGQLWRRILPPPELTEADIVPEGAEPICPQCVLPHHPLLPECPYCGEIVSPYATLLPFVWIWVWGRKLQQMMRAKRWSRLVWAGVVVSAVGFLGDSAMSTADWWSRAAALKGEVADWILRAGAFLVWLAPGSAYLGAGLRMLEAAARRWGTWREEVMDDAAPAPEG